MTKREMQLQWDGEPAQPITRNEAARVIRGNRRLSKARPELRLYVIRKERATHIASAYLGVGCCIAGEAL